MRCFRENSTAGTGKHTCFLESDSLRTVPPRIEPRLNTLECKVLTQCVSLRNRACTGFARPFGTEPALALRVPSQQSLHWLCASLWNRACTGFYVVTQFEFLLLKTEWSQLYLHLVQAFLLDSSPSSTPSCPALLISHRRDLPPRGIFHPVLRRSVGGE